MRALRYFIAPTVIISLFAALTSAAPINVDEDGSGPSSFRWQGLDFSLIDDPDDSSDDGNIAHTITGESNGAITATLQDEGAVYYLADLPDLPEPATYSASSTIGPGIVEPDGFGFTASFVEFYGDGQSDTGAGMLYYDEGDNTPYASPVPSDVDGDLKFGEETYESLGLGYPLESTTVIDSDGTLTLTLDAGGNGSSDGVGDEDEAPMNYEWDLTPNGGVGSYSGFDQVNIQFLGQPGQSFTFNDLSYGAVPEPSTLGLLGLAALPMFVLRSRDSRRG